MEELPPWLHHYKPRGIVAPRFSKFERFVQFPSGMIHLMKLTIIHCGDKSLLQDPMNMDKFGVLRVYNCLLGGVSFRKVAKVRKIIFKIETKFRVVLRKPVRQGVYPHLQHLWINSFRVYLAMIESLSMELITLDLSYYNRLREINELHYLTRLEQLNISGLEEIEELTTLSLLTSLKERILYVTSSSAKKGVQIFEAYMFMNVVRYESCQVCNVCFRWRS